MTFAELFPSQKAWAQGGWPVTGIKSDENNTCLGLGIRKCLNTRYWATPEYKAGELPEETVERMKATEKEALQLLGFEKIEDLYIWNDMPERTFAEIKAACRKLDLHFFPTETARADKLMTSHGCELSPEEAAEVRRKLFGDPT